MVHASGVSEPLFSYPLSFGVFSFSVEVPVAVAALEFVAISFLFLFFIILIAVSALPSLAYSEHFSDFGACDASPVPVAVGLCCGAVFESNDCFPQNMFQSWELEVDLDPFCVMVRWDE